MNRTLYLLGTICLLALLATACGSRRRAATVTVASPPPSTPASGSCQSTLAVSQVQIRAGCEIDDRVGGQQGTLSFPCGGADGPASASFADAVFQGGVNRGELDISIETAFQFTDGCTWRTKQRISGMMSGGALSYSYEEQPDPGQSGCARGCVGSAQVQLY